MNGETISMVRLHDGREVPSDNDAWRHECEARAILSLATLADRRAWLEMIEHKRGRAEADRLRETMKSLWKGAGA